MLFPTKTKVEARLEKVLYDLEVIHYRLRKHEDQLALARRLGLGLEGVELFEMRAVRDELSLLITDALTGVRNGSVSHKGIVPQLRNLGKSIVHFDQILNETDASAVAGRAAFRARIGYSRASN